MKRREHFFVWIYGFLVSVTPLMFLPVTQDFYDTNKWMAFVALSLFFMLAAAWQFARTSTIRLSWRPSTIGLAAITVASFISLWIASANRVEALLNPFGPITFAVLTFLSFFASSFWDTHASRRLFWLLFAATSFLGLIAVYQFAGVAKFMFPNVTFLADRLWTPTGSSAATAAMLTIVLPLLFKGIAEGQRHKQHTHLTILIIMTLTVVAGLGITLWQLFPKLSTIFLSPREGWIVLLEILKAPRQAMAGVGAENFLTAFTAGRPARLNLTPLWTARFTTNSNFLFHITTVYGLVGASAAVIFLKNLIARKHKDALFVSLCIAFASLLLTPPSLSLLIVITGLLIASEIHDTPAPKHIQIPGWIRGSIFTACLFGVIFAFWVLGRAYAAEVYFARSLATAQKNDGRETYNLQIKAIERNPNVTRFHMTYSQTNLALAVSLSETIRELSQATEEEQAQNRTLVAQLIQQAIREAKTAVNLNPSNILAWENLARVYQQLIGVAKDADTWAVTTYRQAIALDPYNPILALELGGVYVQMNNFTDAVTQLIRATNLKPDYANAWYNLANAYRLNGDDELAVSALQKTQTLLDPSSSDYRIVSEQLEEARAPKAAKPQAQEQDSQVQTLTTPAPIPVIIPPLELPNE